MLYAKITRVVPDVPLPEYHSAEAAAFDVCSGEDVVVLPGEVKLVRTGLIIQAPEGYFLMLAARSGLAPKKGLQMANGIGVIDRDYSGPTDELRIILRNPTTESISITKGERLVQGIFLPVQQVEWEEVEQIRDASRGGIGSTGGYSA